MNRKNEIPEKELLETLIKELGSMGKVAVLLNKPYGTVRAWFNKYKIDRPKSCRTIYNELRSLSLSNSQRSVVLGSILGDGGLTIPKRGKNAKLTIKHCTKQRSYLNWKKELLNPFSRPIYQSTKPGPVVINGIRSYDTGSYTMYTVVHPELTDFYWKFYKKGKKRVDSSVIDSLDILSVAILLADDGTFYSDSKYKGVCAGKICTNSFYYHEQEILLEALKKFYGEDGLSIIPHNREKNQYVIKMSNSKNTASLLEKIRKILPECIHYKLDPQRLHAKPLTVLG